ncbi:MAG: hypothetical protein RJA52_1408 [Bacteroidota bacterium]
MKGIEPLTPSLPWKCSTPELHWQCQNRENRAGDETRTRDPQLGRLMLYQLSYARILFPKFPTSGKPKLIRLTSDNNGGGDRIRTYSVINNRFTVCPVSPTSAHPHISQ